MLKYVLKRILLVIPTMLGIVLIIFAIMELTPGDPALIMLGNKATPEAIEKIHKELNLDDPFALRYANYIIDFVKDGDMGISYQTKRPVTDELMARLPTTLKLATYSIIFAVLLGIPLGVLSAVKQYSIFDILGVTGATLLASVPSFWFGLMAILVFALNLGWLPSNGSDSFAHFILPSITNGAATLASLLRMTRATMLETIREDYINTVRAKGQKEGVVIFNHALKNAILPVVTVIGMEFGWLLGGALVIEQVFSINGLGSCMINAIRSQDLPMVTGCVVVLAFFFVMVMLIVDIVYTFIDPRVKARYAKGVKA